MSKLDELINTPMSTFTALFTESLLLIVAIWLFSDGETVAGILSLVLIELRHFRHVYHVNTIKDNQ